VKPDSIVCTECQETFTLEHGIIHFVKDGERPQNPINLAQSSDIQSAELYRKNAERDELRYRQESAVRDYVDFVASSEGIVVDLATGPGGGHIASTLKRLNPEAILVATDACPPVIRFQYQHFKPMYGDQFEFLDVDLSKAFPFKTGSIDIFCGLSINNVAGISETLPEVTRCLKPNGTFVIGQRFYAQDSKTAQYLTERGSIFASFEVFESYCKEIGLKVTQFDTLHSHKGKSDPKDGLPLDENDEWAHTHMYLEKAKKH
jgi:SAM-dependent methyltransferase